MENSNNSGSGQGNASRNVPGQAARNFNRRFTPEEIEASYVEGRNAVRLAAVRARLRRGFGLNDILPMHDKESARVDQEENARRFSETADIATKRELSKKFIASNTSQSKHALNSILPEHEAASNGLAQPHSDILEQSFSDEQAKANRLKASTSVIADRDTTVRSLEVRYALLKETV